MIIMSNVSVFIESSGTSLLVLIHHFMQFIKRIFFFFLTNIAVLFLLSVVFAIIGYFFPGLQNMGGGMIPLLIYAALFWFLGSFISLWISRWSAKRIYSIQLLTQQTAVQDAKLQVVWNIVSRIALQNNIQMPEVGYYESSDPNAFATWATKNSALVAVSTGLLHAMERNEIEGVVGHEMAHVINGDMVTLTLLQGVMNTFVIFFSSIAARAVAASLSQDDKENALSFFVYQAIYIIFQLLFGFLAMIVIMYFSRIREYHADLGWATFAGKMNMIAGLKKLQSITKLIHTKPTDSKMTAFMIQEPDSLFSTHPSLENRIKALEENYQLV